MGKSFKLTMRCTGRYAPVSLAVSRKREMNVFAIILTVTGMLYCVWLGYFQPNHVLVILFIFYLVSLYVATKSLSKALVLMALIINTVSIVVGVALLPYIVPQWSTHDEGLAKFSMVMTPFLFIGPPFGNVLAIIGRRKQWAKNQSQAGTHG